MLPVILLESQIHPFSFYFDSEMHQGMSHDKELYGLVDEFKVEQKFRAYHVACQFTSQGNQVVLASSASRYQIWISLRSPYYQSSSSFYKAKISGNPTWEPATSVLHQRNESACQTLILKSL